MSVEVRTDDSYDDDTNADKYVVAATADQLK
jgi:hypothetical protein